MDTLLKNILTELEYFGESNDQNKSNRSERMLNITRDTGEFLSVLIRATNAQQVLEIGTSNGYSTLWLAAASKSIGGEVTTVDISKHKFELASQNFSRTNLSPVIKQVYGNAGDLLVNAENDSYDLVFLDSERSEYSNWWPDLKRVIRPGGLLVVDNAVSHRDEMAPFISLVESDQDFTTCLIPIGKGEYLATRSRS